MHRTRVIPGCILTLILIGWPLFAQVLDYQGQLSGWYSVNRSDRTLNLYGLRYIPSFAVEKMFSDNKAVNLEASFNGYRNGQFETLRNVDSEGEIKPYRLWIRFATARFEARLGLQKINFGSATLFRPLMWFDAIDPRDPLQITDGVYALLFRYYFMNNANFWIWGLYGNKHTRGWEVYETRKNSFEYGGRLQYPLSAGEIGFSFHQRQMSFNYMSFPQMKLNEEVSYENRFAVDGKWDVEIGFWFEGVLTHQDNPLLPFVWQRSATLGADYTFDIGNGLNVMSEYFILENSREALGKGEGLKFSAGSFSYPIGLLDRVEGIFYYDWENSEYYRFLNWRRTYDHWSFHLMAFLNPDKNRIYQNQAGNNLFAGKGVQLMIVLNH
ncbi:MAG: hypothetical protein P8184_05195 [Calditrichia bacterium]